MKKLEYIDALRGWAIFAVLAVHCSTWVTPDLPWLRAIASKGAVGVQLFYLVSAFTLLLSWNSRVGEPHARRNYLIRRFFRVAPMFYVAILVYGPLRDALAPRYWMPEGVQAWHYLTAFTFTHGWHPKSVNALVPGGWSMGVEMTFYLLFPALVLIVTSLRRAIAFVIISLVLGMLISQLADWWYSPIVAERYHRHIASFAYTYIPTVQICIFALGFVLYFWTRAASRVNFPPAAAPGFILLGLAMQLVLVFVEVPVLPGFFVFSLAFLPLVFGLSQLPVRAIVNKMSCRLGELSYSIYLIHFGVIYLLQRIAPRFEITSSLTLNYLLCLAAVTVVTTGLSLISYRLVERKGIALGRKVIEKLST